MLIGVLLIIMLVIPNFGAADTIIFDNGMNHIFDARLASPSTGGGVNQSADDFLIGTGGIITDVHWRGNYIPNENEPIPDVDNFFIRFYNDAGGVPTPPTPPGSPGSHIYEANVGAVGRMDTGLQEGDSPSLDIYEYWAFIDPFNADPGVRYWIEIFNDIDTNWFWSMDLFIGDGVSSESGSTWIFAGDEHAFQLTSVPEPSTMLLLGGGLLGLLAFRRKFRK